MNKAATLALLGLLTLTACGERTDSTGPAAPARPTSHTTTGQADVEDPKTGTNSARPDSPKDLKPGTDGSTAPPPPAP